MRKFMDEDFLLTTQTARLLYHLYAAKLPIIDFSAKLRTGDCSAERHWSSIADILLSNDAAHRAMRSCGIDKKFITGDASDYEKFRAWCTCMPSMIGNPLFHIHHLALRRYFGCTLIINSRNCDAIWAETAEQLSSLAYSSRTLIANAHLTAICIPEDPVNTPNDDIAHNANTSCPMQVYPLLAPDRLMEIDRTGFSAYLTKLGDANGFHITDLASLEAALVAAFDRFEAAGCRGVSVSLTDFTAFVRPDPYHADQALRTAQKTDGREVSPEQLACFRAQIMRLLGRECVRRNRTMQLHFAAETSITAQNLLLSYLTDEGALPPTAAYPHVILTRVPTVKAAVSGDAPGSLREQIGSLAENSALGKSLGLSSHASLPLIPAQHEYFRRTLCAQLGEWVEGGLYPADTEALAELVCDICFNNAKNFFGLGL